MWPWSSPWVSKSPPDKEDSAPDKDKRYHCELKVQETVVTSLASLSLSSLVGEWIDSHHCHHCSLWVFMRWCHEDTWPRGHVSKGTLQVPLIQEFEHSLNRHCLRDFCAGAVLGALESTANKESRSLPWWELLVMMQNQLCQHSTAMTYG